MAGTPWQLSGHYFENCSCNYLCPCITDLSATPTRGHCIFAMVFQIEQGRYGTVSLDNLNFVVVGRSPGAMVDGNWSVGLIVDERASPEQQQALTAIASGQAGGPMAGFGPLISNFLGVETAPIQIQRQGMRASVSIPRLLDLAAEAVASQVVPDEPLYLDNTIHPANKRLALARASRSHLHAFGIDWDDDSGRNNGHLAPFSWQGS